MFRSKRTHQRNGKKTPSVGKCFCVRNGRLNLEQEPDARASCLWVLVAALGLVLIKLLLPLPLLLPLLQDLLAVVLPVVLLQASTAPDCLFWAADEVSPKWGLRISCLWSICPSVMKSSIPFKPPRCSVDLMAAFADFRPPDFEIFEVLKHLTFDCYDSRGAQPV